MTELFEALAVGFAFGWLLEKAGLSRYDRIVNVYRFRDLAVLKVLLTALVVGAIGIQVLVGLQVAGPISVPSTFLVGNTAGGVVFGVGMAVSGFCPGTVAAGAGEGRLDYLIPGMLGLVMGALAFGAAYPTLLPLVARHAEVGATLPRWLDVTPWLVAVLLAELAFLLFYVIERGARRAPPGT